MPSPSDPPQTIMPARADALDDDLSDTEPETDDEDTSVVMAVLTLLNLNKKTIKT